MSPEPPVSRHDDDDKLHWEVEKLRAEAESLRRPFYLSPATLIAIVTAAVTLLGAGVQYRLNQIAADRADLEAARNTFRAELARNELERLEKAKAELTSNIDAIQTENKRVSEQLASVQSQLATAETGIQVAAASAASAEAKQALTQAQSTVAALKTETSASEKVQADRAERLRVIRERVLTPALPSNLRVIQ
jgi:chromosome segregation ATPase